MEGVRAICFSVQVQVLPGETENHYQLEKVQLFIEMIANAGFSHGLRKVKDEREFNSLIVAGRVNTH